MEQRLKKRKQEARSRRCKQLEVRQILTEEIPSEKMEKQSYGKVFLIYMYNLFPSALEDQKLRTQSQGSDKQE